MAWGNYKNLPDPGRSIVRWSDLGPAAVSNVTKINMALVIEHKAKIPGPAGAPSLLLRHVLMLGPNKA